MLNAAAELRSCQQVFIKHPSHARKPPRFYFLATKIKSGSSLHEAGSVSQGLSSCGRRAETPRGVGVLVLRPGTEPHTPALQVDSPPWTTREAHELTRRVQTWIKESTSPRGPQMGMTETSWESEKASPRDGSVPPGGKNWTGARRGSSQLQGRTVSGTKGDRSGDGEQGQGAGGWPPGYGQPALSRASRGDPSRMRTHHLWATRTLPHYPEQTPKELLKVQSIGEDSGKVAGGEHRGHALPRWTRGKGDEAPPPAARSRPPARTARPLSGQSQSWRTRYSGKQPLSLERHMNNKGLPQEEHLTALGGKKPETQLQAQLRMKMLFKAIFGFWTNTFRKNKQPHSWGWAPYKSYFKNKSNLPISYYVNYW